MALAEVARLSLPGHAPEGEFDHAAIDAASDRLYVAHPSNDCVEVVDLGARRSLRSLTGLKGVAGVWVPEGSGQLFTSNRGEDTVSVFGLPTERETFRMPTGARPNGIAFDPSRGRLAVAGVGDVKAGAPPTLTVYDAGAGRQVGQLRMPGRTRWALYHAPTDAFYVNIADPAEIVEVSAEGTSVIRRHIAIPGVGPHGLERDPDGRTAYCACDGAQLVEVDLPTGRARPAGSLAGTPDVLWLNRRLHRLYVAIGDPGVVQAFGTHPLRLLETVPTAAGAHTLTLDSARNQLHVFLPESHEDLVLQDG